MAPELETLALIYDYTGMHLLSSLCAVVLFKVVIIPSAE